MRAPIFVRALTDDERKQLEAGLRSADGFRVRRSQIVLASARGQQAQEIAENVGCSHETVRQVIHGFNAQGVDILVTQSRRPHQTHPAFDAEGLERLRALLHRSPREFGYPTSLWTLALVAEVSFAQEVTATHVSGETIRQSLLRLGITWQRAKHWITSPDPAYTRKKSGATG